MEPLSYRRSSCSQPAQHRTHRRSLATICWTWYISREVAETKTEWTYIKGDGTLHIKCVNVFRACFCCPRVAKRISTCWLINPLKQQFFFFIFSPRSHKLSYDDNDGLALLQIEAHSSNVVKALGQTHSVSKLFREHFHHGPFDLIHWLQYSARSISQFPECPSEMNKLILTELNNFEFEENDGSEVYGEKKKEEEEEGRNRRQRPVTMSTTAERAQRLWVFRFRRQKERCSFPPSARRWLTPLKAQRMNGTEMMEHGGSFQKQSCDTKGFITHITWFNFSWFHVVHAAIMLH